jgi:hypothetical protein
MPVVSSFATQNSNVICGTLLAAKRCALPVNRGASNF